MEIITNNHPRPIIYGCELTEKERAEFDYYTDDELDTALFSAIKIKYTISENLQSAVVTS